MLFDADDLARIDALCALGADAVKRGLVLASGGNLSVRLADGSFAVTSSGAWLDRLDRGSFSVMTSEGESVGGAPMPSSEWKLHQRAYAARPDARTVIHVHPQYAVLVVTLGHDIRLLTLDHAYYVRSVGTTEFFPNGSDELADSAAEQLLSHDCVVMKHHGCTVVADEVDMAYRRVLNLEEAARSTVIAYQLGDTGSEFPPEEFARLHHA